MSAEEIRALLDQHGVLTVEVEQLTELMSTIDHIDRNSHDEADYDLMFSVMADSSKKLPTAVSVSMREAAPFFRRAKDEAERKLEKINHQLAAMGRILGDY